MYLKRDPKRQALNQKGAQISQGTLKTTYVEQDCKSQRKRDLHPQLWGASFEKIYRNDIPERKIMQIYYKNNVCLKVCKLRA